VLGTHGGVSPLAESLFADGGEMDGAFENQRETVDGAGGDDEEAIAIEKADR